MDDNPFQKAPYFDWALDRWKLGVIVLLFFVLLITTLVRPDWAFTAPTPVTPEAAAVSADAPTSAENGAVAETAPTPAQTERLMPGANAALPLTLANLGPNAVVPAFTVTELYGTGEPGVTIEVHDLVVPSLVAGEPLALPDASRTLLGTAVVDDRGLWHLENLEPLIPGQHVLELSEVSAARASSGAAVPVVVTVQDSNAEAPLALATPAIRFPSAGARLQEGRITYLGSALPGMQIKLYVDNRLVGEAVAGAQEGWQLTPETSLPAGVYVARVAAISPQGEIVAESAPVAFAVYAPDQSAIPAPLPPDPAVPMQVDGVAFTDAGQEVLLLDGLATPFTSIGAWQDERPVWFVNTRVDGRWQMWLVEAKSVPVDDLTVRSNLGEVAANLEDQVSAAATVPAYPPLLLSPATGDVLTTRQPVLLGLAEPASEVSVMVDGAEVARILADRQGQWAFQVTTPLPEGEVTLTASNPEVAPTVAPVLVTIAPNM